MKSAFFVYICACNRSQGNQVKGLDYTRSCMFFHLPAIFATVPKGMGRRREGNESEDLLRLIVGFETPGVGSQFT